MRGRSEGNDDAACATFSFGPTLRSPLTPYLSFAGVAVLMFHGNISEDYDPNDDDQFDVLDPQAQLNTMDEALYALFQIAVTNNWQDIMFINIVDGQKVQMWGSVFFIAYFVVVVWFGTNIMGAVVIEAYVTAVDRRDLEAKERQGGRGEGGGSEAAARERREGEAQEQQQLRPEQPQEEQVSEECVRNVVIIAGPSIRIPSRAG